MQNESNKRKYSVLPSPAYFKFIATKWLSFFIENVALRFLPWLNKRLEINASTFGVSISNDTFDVFMAAVWASDIRV